MKFRKIYLMIIFSIVVQFFSSARGISQDRGPGELIFSVSGLEDNSKTYISVTPKSGKTRWRDADGILPYDLFVPCPDYFSSTYYDSSLGGNTTIVYFEAPDDPGNDNKCIPYGIYTINIWNTTHSFDETFDLNLKTADWEQGIGYQEDLYIEVFFGEDPDELNYFIANTAGTTAVDITYPYVNEIWDWFPEAGDQNQTDLKVPITYGTSHYGLEFIVDEETAYYYPTTADTNYGWTESVTFQYISPQSRWGYDYAFTQWKGGGTSSTKNITVDDEHDSYEAIAQYTQTIPTPTGFNIGVRNDHPYLTWTAVTGDSMAGYKIWRNYDSEGWVLRATINDDETSSWSDIEVDYDLGGDPVSYKMQTKDFEGDTSLCTSAQGTKGYLLADELNPTGEADIASVSFQLKPNVPNPFNPSTAIGYSLAVKSNVVLSIYNVLGKKIRTLVDEEKSMGEHSSIWDGKDDYGRPVSAGVYIYTIMANPVSVEDGKPFRASGKMLMTK